MATRSEADKFHAEYFSHLRDLQIEARLFPSEVLGMGSYGKVMKAEFYGTPCAAKQLHDIFVIDTQPHEKEKLFQDYVAECQCWAKLRHPNIVQLYGVLLNSQNDIPVYLMEKMDVTLRRYIERQKKEDFLLVSKVSVLCQVAQGLCYLHNQSPPLVHSDLSTNNILLNECTFVAKLSDFGMTRALDFTSTKLSFAKGTLAFMPPEIMQRRPEYGVEVDIFSFGNCLLSVISHEWPYPVHSTKIAEGGEGLVALSEWERRKHQVSTMNKEERELFEELIKNCLENNPKSRPNSRIILDHLKITESNLMTSSSTASHEPHVQFYVDKIRQLEEKIVRLELAAPQPMPTVEAKQSVIKTTEDGSGSPKQRKKKKRKSASTAKGDTEERKVLEWKELQRLPNPQISPCIATTGNMIFVGGGIPGATGDASTVWMVDLNEGKLLWEQLPKLPLTIKWFAIASIPGRVFVLGGLLTTNPEPKETKVDPRHMKTVFSLHTHMKNLKWTRYQPDLNEERCNASAIGFDSYIVVAGGLCRGEPLSSIELIDTSMSKSCKILPALPRSLAEPHLTICNEILYIGLGWHTDNKEVTLHKTIYYQSLESITSQQGGRKVASKPWVPLIDVPLFGSALTSIDGMLLTIAGSEDSHNQVNGSNKCYGYIASQKIWLPFPEIRAPRILSAAACTNSNKILVCGGIHEKTPVPVVEIGTFVSLSN